MKLGAAWFGFRRQTYENYFEMAAALGMPYVEMPLYWQIVQENHNDDFSRYSSTRVKTMRQLADTIGIQMVSSVSELELAATLDMQNDGTAESVVSFARVAARRTIDIGASLGISVLRLTEPNIGPDVPITEAKRYMEAYGSAMGELGDYASAKNVRIVVENYGLTSQQMNWLLDAADHPAVGTLYDPCNYFRLGEDPLSALKNLGHRVYYCHLKDTRRAASQSPDSLFKGSRWSPSVAVGEGDIDWEPIFAQLATFYEGYLCIEYEIAEDIMRGTRSSLEYIKGILKKLGRLSENQ